MTSKLNRQKQIFSLMNSKIVNERQEVRFNATETASAKSAEKTERGRDQDQLLNQIFHFHKSIVQHINAGLITIDKNGEITFANKSAAALLGYPVETLLGAHIRKFITRPDAVERLRQIASMPGQKIDGLELGVQHQNGKEIPAGIDAAYFEDRRNGVDGTVLLIRDLSEIEQMRKRMARMERLALLGELSAGIAHEIRNPLAGIKAASQMLEDRFQQDPQGQAEKTELSQQLLERVIREVDKANGLLKEFFRFAKPAPPRPGFCDVETVLDNVVLLLSPRMQKADIGFQKKMPEKMPPVFIDDTQIEQVILNLMLNAIDAMPDGGLLEISTEKKRFGVDDESQKPYGPARQHLWYAQISIKDSGCGIDPAALEKIFNPFFTTKSDGVGLGLAISSRLIEENNARLDVESQAGKGSIFRLALPTFSA